MAEPFVSADARLPESWQQDNPQPTEVPADGLESSSTINGPQHAGSQHQLQPEPSNAGIMVDHTAADGHVGLPNGLENEEDLDNFERVLSQVGFQQLSLCRRTAHTCLDVLAIDCHSCPLCASQYVQQWHSSQNPLLLP